MAIGWCLLFIVVCQLASCHAERTKKSYYRYPSGNIVERLYMSDIILYTFLRLLQDYVM